MPRNGWVELLAHFKSKGALDSSVLSADWDLKLAPRHHNNEAN
jgi:hypothetical protein